MKHIKTFQSFLTEAKVYAPSLKDTTDFIRALNMEMIDKKAGSFWEDHNAEGKHRIAIGKYDHDQYSEETVDDLFAGKSIKDPRQRTIKLIELEFDSYTDEEGDMIRNIIKEFGLNVKIDSLIKKYLEK